MSENIYEKREEGQSGSDLHQKIMDALPIPIFYRDINGVYQSCNKAHEKFIGLSKEELIGKTVYDIQPNEIAEIYARRDREMFDSPGVQMYETQLQYADGSMHDVMFNKAVIRGDDGEIMGVVGSIFDITQKKRAESELEKAEEATQISSIMLHKMRAGVIIADENLKVIDANPSSAHFFGEEIEELYDAIPGLRRADLKKIVPETLVKMMTAVLSSGEEIQERDIKLHNRLLHVLVVTIYKHKVVGAIIRDMSTPVLAYTEIVSRAEEVNRKNLETVQKIAYLLGDNAAQTEELLSSIIESYQYGEEEDNG